MATDFEAKFGMSIHERARLIMEDEKKRNPEPLWWYLSYAGKEGFRGGTIVQAHGLVGACDYARTNHITPGPDVETQGLPIPLDKVPEERYCRRLLTIVELESIWGDMTPLSKLEEENNAE